MSNETILYKTLDLYNNPEFMELISKLQRDTFFCDTCFLPNKNPFNFIKYTLSGEITSNELIIEDLDINIPVTQGKLIKFKFPINTDDIIKANIIYPINKISMIPLCEYYTVFWCNPGIFCCKFPNIILDLETADNKKYRLKGKIVKFIIPDTEPTLYEYYIKLSCCNCFFGLIQQSKLISCKINIIPEEMSDQFKNNYIASNKFSI